MATAYCSIVCFDSVRKMPLSHLLYGLTVDPLMVIIGITGRAGGCVELATDISSQSHSPVRARTETVPMHRVAGHLQYTETHLSHRHQIPAVCRQKLMHEG